MNLKVTRKAIQWAALLVLCLGTAMALFIFSNRERQPWNHMQLIGINGHRMTSIWAGQSGDQKFARLLRALPALAKARMANWRLMTPFEVQAAGHSCAAVKAAVVRVAQSSPRSQVKPDLQCFMCYAMPTNYQCFTSCTDDDYYDEYYNTGMENCSGVDYPLEPRACEGCETAEEGCYNDGCDGC
jgi:hypothetical protein